MAQPEVGLTRPTVPPYNPGKTPQQNADDRARALNNQTLTGAGASPANGTDAHGLVSVAPWNSVGSGWHAPLPGGSRTTPGASSSAPAPWLPASAPGFGEDYWKKTGNEWLQPGAGALYWAGNSGWFTGGPTSQETTIQGYGDQLGNGPGALENLYDQFLNSGQFTNPGANEEWYAQHSGDMNGPGAGETGMGRIAGQLSSTAGDAENYYANNKDYIATPGDMEKFYANNSGKLQAPSFLAQNQGGISSDINSARSMDNFWNANGGNLGQQGYTERLANQGGPSSSYSESLMNNGSGPGGLDQLYGRLFDTSARKLDEAAAARGGFNSGASLRAQEELGADLNAQHVKDYMAAAGQADSSMMSRLGYGLNLASSGDSAMRDRLGLGFQGATSADATALARANASSGLYKDLGSEQRSNLGMAADWANQSQASGISRLLAGGTLANNSETQWRGRLKDSSDAYNAMDLLGQNRFKLGSDASNTSQLSQTNRLKMALSAADSTQSQYINRLKTAGDLQHLSESDILSRLLGGGTLATAAGNEDILRRTAGQNAANSAQSDKQNRENSVFDNLLRQAQAQGGAYSSGMDKTRSEQLQLQLSQIDGLLKKGQIDQATADQMRQMYMQLLQMPISAAGFPGVTPRSQPLPTQVTSGGTGDPYGYNGSNFLG